MTDERPPGSIEPTQAELRLDDVIPDSPDEPDEPAGADLDAPPTEDLPTNGLASSDDDPLEDDSDLTEAGESQLDIEAPTDAIPAPLDTFDYDDESDVDNDVESEFEPEFEPTELETETEAELEFAAAVTAAPAPPSLPTSWPDPIPVGKPAVVTSRFDGVRITPPVVILGSLVTIAFLMFVAIEPTPRWLLLFTAVIAILGTDGALRQAWPRPFGQLGTDSDTTPYLFLPALTAIAWPMLVEHNVGGFLAMPAALLAGIAFTVMVTAQLSSVRVTAPVHPYARLVSTAAVYFSAFALFSLSYILDVSLPASIAAVGVIAAMLSVELFREGEVDPLETLVFAGVTGVILGEARWAMYYVPIGGYLAGLALLLGFFLVTGLLHSHLTRRLNNIVALEYGGIAAAGVLLVAIAGQAGLG